MLYGHGYVGDFAGVDDEGDVPVAGLGDAEGDCGDVPGRRDAVEAVVLNLEEGAPADIELKAHDHVVGLGGRAQLEAHPEALVGLEVPLERGEDGAIGVGEVQLQRGLRAVPGAPGGAARQRQRGGAEQQQRRGYDARMRYCSDRRSKRRATAR